MLHALERWLDGFDHSTREKAEDYLENGHVLDVHTRESSIIEASVQGTQKKPYLIILQLKKNAIQAECSCHLGFRCKHVVAVGLRYLKSFAKQNSSSSAQEFTPIITSPVELAWLKELETEQPKNLQKSANDLFIYSLSKSRSLITPLEIELHIVRLKKTGGLSSAMSKVYYLNDILNSPPDRFATLLNQEDWEILALLWQHKVRQTNISPALLQKMIATKRCYWDRSWIRSLSPPLQWTEDREGLFEWDITAEGSHKLILRDKQDEEVLSFLMEDGAFYINKNRNSCGLLRLPYDIAIAHKLLKAPPISAKSFPLIKEQLSKVVKEVPIEEKQLINLGKTTPIPHFSIDSERSWNDHEIIIGKLSFKYGESDVPLGEETSQNMHIRKGKTIYRIERDLPKERSTLEHLIQYGWKILSGKLTLIEPRSFEEIALDFCVQFVPPMKAKGWVFHFSKNFPIQNVVDVEENWYAEISEAGENWFDLAVGSVIDGKRVNLYPALQKFFAELSANGLSFESLTPKELKQKIACPMGNGEVALIPASRLKELFEVFLELMNKNEGEEKLRFSKWEIPTLNGLQKLQWQMPESYRLLQEKLQKNRKIESVAPPQGLQCNLRPYQLDGLSWLQFLRTHELGGILADDMGLGKTIQTLAHILVEKESGRMVHPVLIIAPTTLMGNWVAETRRFAPQLTTLVLQGNERKKHFDRLSESDLILTTYPLLARDREILQKQEFHLLILDEAQNIKNAKTQAHRVLRELRAHNRLCLTGTPMENHLGELWSLFHILLPGFLGDEKQFQKLFRKPIEKEGSIERKKVLQRRILPFMLRRTKQEVTLELPPKTEIHTSIALTQKQKDLYEAVRLTMMKKVLAHVEEKGLARSRIILLDALLKLRQICCDPRLLKAAKQVTAEDSAKLTHLREILPQIISEKRQVLIFSQFTSMLKLIEEELNSLNISCTKITGATKDRVTPIQQFQRQEIPIMLISLKAGGTGLNLTAADTVILYDPWWNPAVEAQAMDRAHRIGQTKSVFVYKLIAEGSLEEKILGLQKKKRELAAGLFDASNSAPLELDLQELQSLFAPLE